MTKSERPEEKNALYAEHVLLGAEFADNGTVWDYAYERDDVQDADENVAFLADVSHLTTLLFSGEGADSFAYAAFGGKELTVGSCAFEAALTGDGSIASVPLLARTGVSEFVAFDLSSRADVLVGWLSFLKSVSQDGYAPYESVQMEDATGTHAVLALWGKAATSVLSDYTACESLPREGEVASCMLDKIHCIIARLPVKNCPCYLVLVSPRIAVVLWRSFLSFANVNPVGMKGLQAELRAEFSWYCALDETQQVRIDKQDLAREGLIREVPDFVGARGL